MYHEFDIKLWFSRGDSDGVTYSNFCRTAIMATFLVNQILHGEILATVERVPKRHNYSSGALMFEEKELIRFGLHSKLREYSETILQHSAEEMVASSEGVVSIHLLSSSRSLNFKYSTNHESGGVLSNCMRFRTVWLKLCEFMSYP